MTMRWMLVLVVALGPVACSSGGDDGGRDALPDVVADGAGGDESGLPDAVEDSTAPRDVPTDTAAQDLPGQDLAGGDASVDATVPVDVVADTAATDTAMPDVATDVPADNGGSIDPKCQALASGIVKDFDVDGLKRTFVLSLPNMDGEPRKWPVVFNWHGYGDTAVNMSMLLSGNVNDASFPFIAVTPEDTNLQAPSGMDWDILSVKEPNREARLFDEVLACLDQRYGVDWDHVHSVGFSAGAIMTDLLGVLRGDVIASLVTFSGTYFSDPGNKSALGMLATYVSWPDLTTDNRYAQLLVHGSTADNYNLSVVKLQFDANGKRDVDYLNGLGHDVVHCDHGQGHTIPSALYDAPIVRFLEAHPKGTSPWAAAGLPEGLYPAYCEVKPAP
jgi:hypothetical protein